jgi:hypothetical protein
VTDTAGAHWLRKDQQRRGQFTVQQLYRMVKRGEINNHTPFWSENGKIDKIWRGNAWTPAEVIEEIKHHDE